MLHVHFQSSELNLMTASILSLKSVSCTYQTSAHKVIDFSTPLTFTALSLFSFYSTHHNSKSFFPCPTNHIHFYVLLFYFIISWANKIKKIMKTESVSHSVKLKNLLRLIVVRFKQMCRVYVYRGKNNSLNHTDSTSIQFQVHFTRIIK
jgi:hypothetical protein